MSGGRIFFGSESGDDMKIRHAVSKADSDEEMIHSVNERNTNRHTYLSEIGVHTVSKPNPGMTRTRERDR